jgi:hypothetical protein
MPPEMFGPFRSFFVICGTFCDCIALRSVAQRRNRAGYVSAVARQAAALLSGGQPLSNVIHRFFSGQMSVAYGKKQ